ncbi:MAG: M23 family metallopeptidase [Anaerolineae bacterium]
MCNPVAGGDTSDPADIMEVERKTISLPNRQGLLRRGISPLGDFQVTNVQDDRVVWFVWSDADAKTLGIYNHMVSSFALGRTSPQSLQEIYGPNFHPMKLDSSAPSSSSNDPREVTLANTGASKSLHALRLEQDPGGWRLPFSGQRTITAGPRCSNAHQGASAEAIDYSMPAGTAVKSTYSGVVSWFGWNNQGYGNLLNIDYGPSPVKRAYYAHLQSFGVSYVGQSVSIGATVAYADDTGNSNGTPSL